MTELSQHDPTGRFSGLAAGYARYRPGYPAAALQFIWAECRLQSGSLLVDVGSGTGISSRLFAEMGARVIGVEPNADMRGQAESTVCSAESGRLTYRAGQGEATGLPDGRADALLSAQAFHWLDADAAIREFHRILKPAGCVALMWNERDERDSFTAAYGAVIRTAPGAAEVEVPRGIAGEALLASPLFERARRTVFANEQLMSEEELLGRAFSASYAPREPAVAAEWVCRLHAVFNEYQHSGQVRLKYETSVYDACRAD